ncbi:MAG: hypothetical protein ACRELD_02400 [Longimicrobiales bacterium]
MSQNGLLPLPLIDAYELDDPRRAALRPAATLADRAGCRHRLPRYFYEVGSWETACNTPVAEHFTLHEFMGVDVREAPALRQFPRYVPCAVTLLAAQLELLRQAVGTLVWIAANGGYRSPSHALVDYASPHCWGTAANIYRIGGDYLDTQDSIERFAKVAARVSPAIWIRPYGHEKGFADDHLHVDVGYARLTPRGHDEEAC